MRLYFLISTVCLLTIATSSFAQLDANRFLFSQFEDAQVYYKNNTLSKEKMNYDLLSEAFCFINNATGEILQAADVSNIRIIKFGNRNFIINKGQGIEVLPTNPVIHVQYKTRARPEAAKGAYGTTSETTSTTSYNSISAGGNTVNLDSRKIIATARYNVYWIEMDGKMKKFINFKQLIKIFNNHKDALQNYIKENDIDFDDAEQITKLCIYASGL